MEEEEEEKEEGEEEEEEGEEDEKRKKKKKLRGGSCFEIVFQMVIFLLFRQSGHQHRKESGRNTSQDGPR